MVDHKGVFTQNVAWHLKTQDAALRNGYYKMFSKESVGLVTRF